jgi:hypothetical protein
MATGDNAQKVGLSLGPGFVLVSDETRCQEALIMPRVLTRRPAMGNLLGSNHRHLKDETRQRNSFSGSLDQKVMLLEAKMAMFQEGIRFTLSCSFRQSVNRVNVITAHQRSRSIDSIGQARRALLMAGWCLCRIYVVSNLLGVTKIHSAAFSRFAPFSTCNRMQVQSWEITTRLMHRTRPVVDGEFMGSLKTLGMNGITRFDLH